MLFILTSEKIIESGREDAKGAVFLPTISLENLRPALSKMRTEVDESEPNWYHLEESWNISLAKRQAVNALIEALDKRL